MYLAAFIVLPFIFAFPLGYLSHWILGGEIGTRLIEATYYVCGIVMGKWLGGRV